MAVAGGAASSIKLQIIDGQLWEYGKLYRQQTELVHEVADAVERLSRGEEIAFKTIGGNMIALRAELQTRGIAMLEPIEAAYKVRTR